MKPTFQEWDAAMQQMDADIAKREAGHTKHRLPTGPVIPADAATFWVAGRLVAWTAPGPHGKLLIVNPVSLDVGDALQLGAWLAGEALGPEEAR